MSTQEPSDVAKPTSSLTALVAAAPELSARPISLAGWIQLGVLVLLMVLLNMWQFSSMYRLWQDPNWQHGYAIPFFTLLMLYLRRHEILSAPRVPSRLAVVLGGLVVLAGLAIVVGGFWPMKTRFVSGVGMVTMILGLVWFMNGWRILVLTAVPIMFLGFAVPLPDNIYKDIAFPLQNFAASVSASVMSMCGVKLMHSASAMYVWGVGGTNVISGVAGDPYTLTVAEACSGIRSMMAFLALGVIFAYIEARPVWQRITLVLIIIPVAIFVNVLRVIITALMFVWDKPELGSDFMHTFTGMLMLIPAGLIMACIWWLLKKIYVTDDEEDGDDEAADSGAALSEPVAAMAVPVEGDKP